MSISQSATMSNTIFLRHLLQDYQFYEVSVTSQKIRDVIDWPCCIDTLELLYRRYIDISIELLFQIIKPKTTTTSSQVF